MQKLRTENGITLIALVITIIVMLILVGVSVTVALNGGLFTTAKEAAEGTATKRNEELNLSDGKVEINGEWYNSIEEYVNGGSSNESTDPSEPSTEYTAYSIGDTVTVGTETFYVIANSDETQEKVTLLAKDNIDTTNLVQSSTANTIAFSETAYWADDFTSSPYDLTETGQPDASHYAAKAAYDYGAKIGGTGRLMTEAEAYALNAESYSDIVYGTNGKSSGTSLNYWLGAAGGTSYVYCVYGGGSSIYGNILDFDDVFDDGCGVRPVVEISKSNIS